MGKYDYMELLERALSKVPSKMSKWGRFEVPKAQLIVVGNQTIITNFKDICDALNRDLKHLSLFILHELGTAGVLEEGRAILHGKFAKTSIDSLIERYTKMYVLCPVCGKIDTELKKEKRIILMVCAACGAVSPARSSTKS